MVSAALLVLGTAQLEFLAASRLASSTVEQTLAASSALEHAVAVGDP